MAKIISIGRYVPSILLKELTVCYLDNEEDHIEELAQIFSEGKLNFRNFITTTNPEKAIQLAKDKKIDILICDFKMPERNGLQILRLCKGENSDLKLILYTGFVLSKADLKFCSEHRIRRVKKLDSYNLYLTISIVANEIKDFKNSFEKVNVERKDEKEENLKDRNNELSKNPLSSDLDIEALKNGFKRIAKNLIDDYYKVSKKNKDVVIHISENEIITIQELLLDLENLTPRGIEHIILWNEAEKFIKIELEKDN